jgi:hypothetical protein
MLGGALDVGTHSPCYVLRLLLGHLSCLLGWGTDYEAASGKLASLGDESAGGHDRAFAYLCSVEDRDAHPYETPVPDLAPMHDSPVAYDAPLAHDRRIPRVRVQDTTVLDVRARPYTDRLRVPPQYGPVPDARLLPQVHRSDDVGPRRDEGGFRNFRPLIAKGEQVTDGAIPLPARLALAPAGADSREALATDYTPKDLRPARPRRAQRQVGSTERAERHTSRLENYRPLHRFPPSLELTTASL